MYCMSSKQCLLSRECAPSTGAIVTDHSPGASCYRQGWPCLCCYVVRAFGVHTKPRGLVREMGAGAIYIPWKQTLPADTHCGSSYKPIEVHSYSPYLCVCMSVCPSLSCILIPVVEPLCTTVELISLSSHSRHLE